MKHAAFARFPFPNQSIPLPRAMVRTDEQQKNTFAETCAKRPLLVYQGRSKISLLPPDLLQ